MRQAGGVRFSLLEGCRMSPLGTPLQHGVRSRASRAHTPNVGWSQTPSPPGTPHGALGRPPPLGQGVPPLPQPRVLLPGSDATAASTWSRGGRCTSRCPCSRSQRRLRRAGPEAAGGGEGGHGGPTAPDQRPRQELRPGKLRPRGVQPPRREAVAAMRTGRRWRGEAERGRQAGPGVAKASRLFGQGRLGLGAGAGRGRKGGGGSDDAQRETRCPRRGECRNFDFANPDWWPLSDGGGGVGRQHLVARGLGGLWPAAARGVTSLPVAESRAFSAAGRGSCRA